VFTFFKVKLQELLQQENRRNLKEADYKRYMSTAADPVPETPPAESPWGYQLLMQAIERLRKRDQQIILRRHLLQEKPEQIALHLNITPLAVNNKLYRAMKRLKVEIAKMTDHGNHH